MYIYNTTTFITVMYIYNTIIVAEIATLRTCSRIMCRFKSTVAGVLVNSINTSEIEVVYSTQHTCEVVTYLVLLRRKKQSENKSQLN